MLSLTAPLSSLCDPSLRNCNPNQIYYSIFLLNVKISNKTIPSNQTKQGIKACLKWRSNLSERKRGSFFHRRLRNSLAKDHSNDLPPNFDIPRSMQRNKNWDFIFRIADTGCLGDMEVYLRYCIWQPQTTGSTDSGVIYHIFHRFKSLSVRERERFTHWVKGKTNGFAESLCASLAYPALWSTTCQRHHGTTCAFSFEPHLLYIPSFFLLLSFGNGLSEYNESWKQSTTRVIKISLVKYKSNPMWVVIVSDFGSTLRGDCIKY